MLGGFKFVNRRPICHSSEGNLSFMKSSVCVKGSGKRENVRRKVGEGMTWFGKGLMMRGKGREEKGREGKDGRL